MTGASEDEATRQASSLSVLAGIFVGMKITDTRQRNAVSEGIAFGMVQNDRDKLPFEGGAIDAALSYAWRRWNYGSTFPKTTSDIRLLKGQNIVTWSGVKNQIMNFYWAEEDAGYVVHRRPQWQHGELDLRALAEAIDGDVPADGWRELGAVFLGRLDEDLLRLGYSFEGVSSRRHKSIGTPRETENRRIISRGVLASGDEARARTRSQVGRRLSAAQRGTYNSYRKERGE